MKKFLFLTLVASLTLNVMFFAFGSTMGASAKSVDSSQQTYYLGLWEGCTTLVVQYNLNDVDNSVNKICTDLIKLSLSNNFFKNRYSDMFAPLPIRFK